MTDAEALMALAERCEAATGPDQVLAAEIHCALRGYTMHEDTNPATGHFAFWEGGPWKSQCVNCSSWTDPTASVDEAMTLDVPFYQLDTQTALGGRSWVRITLLINGLTRKAEGYGASRALAETAARLRAHAATCDSGRPPEGEAGTVECGAGQSGREAASPNG